MVNKKSKAKIKAVTKKPETKKKKVVSPKKAKSVKKKTTAKKPTAKNGESASETKAKVKVKSKAKKAGKPKKATVKTKKASAVIKTKSTVVKKLSVVTKANKSLNAIVDKIRDRLLENRGEVMKMLESSQAMERDVEGLTFSNEIDLASSLEGREMVFHLSSRDRKELKLIDDALIKIDNKSYGFCESCEKMISLKRLQILPLTTLCIECQESAEHR